MIVVVGLNHRTAPIELREAASFPRDTLAEALAELRAEDGIREAMILSTCNRVELYAGSADPAAVDTLAARLNRAAQSRGRDLEEAPDVLYRLADEDAVRHAFRVAASLDSMVIGETQILGQVKEAYQLAEQAGTLGPALSVLRQRSLAAAKRARTETGIGRNAVSVSHVACELARKIFGQLAGKQLLLVGTGKMSAIAARHLVRDGAHATVLVGRTPARAEELAQALGGRAAPFEALREQLTHADIVISGTAAPVTVIKRADVEQARAARRHRPLFLIDIAVPRDVDSAVRDLDGVFLYDIDDLKAVADANLRERQKEAQEAEALVEREVRAYLDWQRSLDVVPVLVALRERAEAIRRAEIERARKRLGALTPEQESAVEGLTSAIINKLLHAPTVQLKEMAATGHPGAEVSWIRKLLGL